MTVLTLLAAETSAHLNPIRLFLDADIVVQAVIAGLVIASIWVWTNIVAFAMRLGEVRRRNDAYEREFWKASDFTEFQSQRGKGDVPSARVAAAGLAEWRHSASVKTPDFEGARQRIASALGGAVAAEADRLAEPLNFLATVGSVAPFVGLFGTVWGIMNSFFQIGQQQNSSLAVVAPGISEALFATAIGLFAAIPAVIAYNRLTHGLDRLEARLGSFADRFHATLSRELEGG